MKDNNDLASQLARMGVQSQLIFRKIKNAKDRERFSFIDLQNCAGLSKPPFPANSREYNILQAARGYCKTFGIHFQVIKTEDFYGIEKLTDDDTVQKLRRNTSSIERRANNIAKDHAALRFEELSPSSQLTCNGSLTSLMVVKSVTNPQALEKIDKRLESLGDKYAIPGQDETLKMFMTDYSSVSA